MDIERRKTGTFKSAADTKKSHFFLIFPSPYLSIYSRYIPDTYPTHTRYIRISHEYSTNTPHIPHEYPKAPPKMIQTKIAQKAICLAYINLTTCFTDLHLYVHRISFRIKNAAGNITSSIIAERTIIQSENNAFCILILSAAKIFRVQVIVSDGLSIFRIQYFSIGCDITD